MTRVLVGLETSGAVATVAISVDGVVVARRGLPEQRRHSARLLGALSDVMREGALGRSDLTGVVVGTGPGSFTGVRVAASAGKGIAHALDVPLYGVSSLLAGALAEEVPAETWQEWPGVGPPDPERERDGSPLERVVLFDARGDRLFHAHLRVESGAVEVLSPPGFKLLSEVLDDRSAVAVPHCGDGALRHAEVLEGTGRTVLPAPAGCPSADGLLLHMASPGAPPPLAHPFDWEPDYLRDTGAVRGRGR